jgi:hypothetical protein
VCGMLRYVVRLSGGLGDVAKAQRSITCVPWVLVIFRDWEVWRRVEAERAKGRALGAMEGEDGRTRGCENTAADWRRMGGDLEDANCLIGNVVGSVSYMYRIYQGNLRRFQEKE